MHTTDCANGGICCLCEEKGSWRDLQEIVTSRNEVHNEVRRKINSESTCFVFLTTVSEAQIEFEWCDG